MQSTKELSEEILLQIFANLGKESPKYLGTSRKGILSQSLLLFLKIKVLCNKRKSIASISITTLHVNILLLNTKNVFFVTLRWSM